MSSEAGWQESADCQTEFAIKQGQTEYRVTVKKAAPLASTMNVTATSTVAIDNCHRFDSNFGDCKLHCEDIVEEA